MSVKNVKKFLDLAKSNEKLQKELILINKKLQKEEGNEEKFIADNIVPLAKKNGVIFTAKDFLKYADEQMSTLSEEDLLNVSGGANAKRTAMAWLFAGITAASFAAPAVQQFFSEQPTSSAFAGSNKSSEENSRNNQDNAKSDANRDIDENSKTRRKANVEKNKVEKVAKNDKEGPKASKAEQKNHKNKNRVLPTNSNAKNTPAVPQINVAPSKTNNAKKSAKKSTPTVAPGGVGPTKHAKNVGGHGVAVADLKGKAAKPASKTTDNHEGKMKVQPESKQKAQLNTNTAVKKAETDKSATKTNAKTGAQKGVSAKVDQNDKNKKSNAQPKKETQKPQLEKMDNNDNKKAVAPAEANKEAKAVYSGEYGATESDDVNWTFSDGKLTFSGTGKMFDQPNLSDCLTPWYEYKDDITEVVIGEGITSIGSKAFFGCKKLKSITIPESVERIRFEAFYGCRGLTNINIPNNVESIGERAFCGCRGLTNINIPNNVKSIGEGAFENCRGLTSINIPSSVNFIGRYAFSATSLMQVTFEGNKEPNMVTDTLGYSTFNGFSKDIKIFVPSDYSGYYFAGIPVTKVADKVAETGSEKSTAKLETETNAKTVAKKDVTTKVDQKDKNNEEKQDVKSKKADKKQKGTESSDKTTKKAEVVESGDCGAEGSNVKYTIYDDDTMVISGEGAIKSYNYDISPWKSHNVKTVIIKNDVTSIGDEAFEDCRNLTSVTIPASVTSIGESAFNCCSSLTSVTIPASVTSIGEFAFSYCDSLTSVTFEGDESAEVRKNAFSDCAALKKVNVTADFEGDTFGGKPVSKPGEAPVADFTSGAKKNEDGCAKEASEPKAIHKADDIELAGKRLADSDLSEALFELKAENGDSSADKDAENEAEGFDKFFGDGYTAKVVKSGDCGAEGSNVKYTIYDDDTMVISGEGAIKSYKYDTLPWNSYNVKTVIIENGVTSIGNSAFNKCKSLTSITIPDSVTSIGESAFNYCSSLTSITIPDSVTSINDFVFCNCVNLHSIDIRGNVETVGNMAFGSCTSLKSLTYHGTGAPKFGANVFDDCKDLEKVNVTADFKGDTFGGKPVRKSEGAPVADFTSGAKKNEYGGAKEASETNAIHKADDDNVDNSVDNKDVEDEAGGFDNFLGDVYSEESDEQPNINSGVNNEIPDWADEDVFNERKEADILMEKGIIDSDDDFDKLFNEVADEDLEVKPSKFTKKKVDDDRIDDEVINKDLNEKGEETKEVPVSPGTVGEEEHAENVGGYIRDYSSWHWWNITVTSQADHLIEFLNKLPKTNNNLPDLGYVSEETRARLEMDIIHVAKQLRPDPNNEEEKTLQGGYNPVQKIARENADMLLTLAKNILTSGTVTPGLVLEAIKDNIPSSDETRNLPDLLGPTEEERKIDLPDLDGSNAAFLSDALKTAIINLPDEQIHSDELSIGDERKLANLKRRLINSNDLSAQTAENSIEHVEAVGQMEKTDFVDNVGGQEYNINEVWQDIIPKKGKNGKKVTKDEKGYEEFEGQTPMSYLKNKLPKAADGLPDIGGIEDRDIREFYRQLINEVGKNIFADEEGILYYNNSKLFDGLQINDDDDIKMMLLLYDKLNDDALEILKSLPQKEDGSADLSKVNVNIVNKLLPAIIFIGEPIVKDKEFDQYKFVCEELKKGWFGETQVAKETEYTKILNLSQDELKLLYKTREALPAEQKVSFVKILNDLSKTEEGLPDLNKADPTIAMYLRLSVLSLGEQITQNKDGSYSISDEARARFNLTDDDIKTIKILGDRQAKIEKSYNRKQTAIGIAQGVALGGAAAVAAYFAAGAPALGGITLFGDGSIENVKKNAKAYYKGSKLESGVNKVSSTATEVAEKVKTSYKGSKLESGVNKVTSTVTEVAEKVKTSYEKMKNKPFEIEVTPETPASKVKNSNNESKNAINEGRAFLEKINLLNEESTANLNQVDTGINAAQIDTGISPVNASHLDPLGKTPATDLNKVLETKTGKKEGLFGRPKSESDAKSVVKVDQIDTGLNATQVDIPSENFDAAKGEDGTYYIPYTFQGNEAKVGGKNQNVKPTTQSVRNVQAKASDSAATLTNVKPTKQTESRGQWWGRKYNEFKTVLRGNGNTAGQKESWGQWKERKTDEVKTLFGGKPYKRYRPTTQENLNRVNAETITQPGKSTSTAIANFEDISNSFPDRKEVEKNVPRGHNNYVYRENPDKKVKGKSVDEARYQSDREIKNVDWANPEESTGHLVKRKYNDVKSAASNLYNKVFGKKEPSATTNPVKTTELKGNASNVPKTDTVNLGVPKPANMSRNAVTEQPSSTKGNARTNNFEENLISFGDSRRGGSGAGATNSTRDIENSKNFNMDNQNSGTNSTGTFTKTSKMFEESQIFTKTAERNLPESKPSPQPGPTPTHLPKNSNEVTGTGSRREDTLKSVVKRATDKANQYASNHPTTAVAAKTAFMTAALGTGGYIVGKGISAAANKIKGGEASRQGTHENPHGNCGEAGHEADVKWEIVNGNKLVISGTGKAGQYYADIERGSVSPFWQYRDSITSIEIKHGVEDLGVNMFSKFKNLVKVNIPGSVINMGKYTFWYCNKLSEVNYYGKSSFDRSNVFYKCSTLRQINVSEDFSKDKFCGIDIKKCLQKCGENLYYRVDGTILDIFGEGAMTNFSYSDKGVASPWRDYADKITAINILPGVTSIGNSSFLFFTNVQSVNIPASVASIGTNAFLECDNLEDFKFWGTNCSSSGTNAIENCPKLKKVKVPVNFRGNDFYGIPVDKCLPAVPDDGPGGGGDHHDFDSDDDHSQDDDDNNNNDDDYGHRGGGGGLLPGGGKPTGSPPATPGPGGGPPGGHTTNLSGGHGPDGNNDNDNHNKENFSCKLDGTTLTISGKGAVKDYAEVWSPWTKYKKIAKSIKISDGMTVMKDNAFAGFDVLESIDIPASVTSIYIMTIYNCPKLKKVTFQGLKDPCKNMDAIWNCKELKEVEVPENYKGNTFGRIPVNKCLPAVPDGGPGGGGGGNTVDSDDRDDGNDNNDGKTLSKEHNDEATPTLGEFGENHSWSFKDGILTVSGEGDMPKIKGGQVPWQHLKDKITKVVMGKNVTSICPYAFSNFSELVSIDMPATVKSIGDCAFKGCTSLTSITIPDSVMSMGHGAFNGCSSLQTVIINGEMKSISNYAFNNCSSLTSVTIPASVKVIGERAFEGCTSLSSINIPNSVTEIKAYAFRNCSSLVSIVIPPSVTSIGASAFNGCGLTSVIIEKNVESVGNYAFANCTKLTRFVYGGSGIASSFGGEATFESSGLENVIVSKDYKTIYFGGKNVVKMTQPEIEALINSAKAEGEKKEVAPAPSTVPASIPVQKEKADDDAVEQVAAVRLEEFNEAFNELKDKDYDTDLLIVANKTTKETVERFAKTNAAALKPINDALKKDENEANKKLKQLKYKDGIIVDGDEDKTLNKIVGEEATKKKRKGFTKLGIMARFACEAFGEEGGIIDNPQKVNVLHLQSVSELAPVKAEGEKKEAAAPAPAQPEAATEGKFGENINWKFEGETLTISGNGAIPNFEGVPWKHLGDQIKNVVIENGVTSTCKNFFSHNDKVVSLIVKGDITKVEEGSFEECDCLESVTFEGNVETFGSSAFSGCKALSKLNYGGNKVPKYDMFYVFLNCEKLTEVNVNEKYEGNDGDEFVRWKIRVKKPAPAPDAEGGGEEAAPAPQLPKAEEKQPAAPAQEALPLTKREASELVSKLKVKSNLKLNKDLDGRTMKLLERFVRTNLEKLRKNDENPVFSFEGTAFNKKLDNNNNNNNNIAKKHRDKTSSKLLQEAAYANFANLINES